MWLLKCCFRSRLPCCTTASHSCESLQSGISHNDFPILSWNPFSLAFFPFAKQRVIMAPWGEYVSQSIGDQDRLVVLLKTTCQKLWSHVLCLWSKQHWHFSLVTSLFNTTLPKLYFKIIFSNIVLIVFMCSNMVPKLFPKIIFIIGTETGSASL